MKTTEKDCLLELERITRLLCYSQINGDELEFFRKTLKSQLEAINTVRTETERKKEARRNENMGR